ncbi:MAG: hypothetical protein K5739_07890 [Lachnospiraceae bacterium]|nr:hypothetical protein [Lachnospiraceae bacterium]
MRKMGLLFCIFCLMMLYGCGKTDPRFADEYNCYEKKEIITFEQPTELDRGVTYTTKLYDPDHFLLLEISNEMTGSDVDDWKWAYRIKELDTEKGQLLDAEFPEVNVMNALNLEIASNDYYTVIVDKVNREIYIYDKENAMLGSKGLDEIEGFTDASFDDEGDFLRVVCDDEMIYILAEGDSDKSVLCLLNFDLQVVYCEETDGERRLCNNRDSGCAIAVANNGDYRFYKYNAKRKKLEEERQMKCQWLACRDECIIDGNDKYDYYYTNLGTNGNIQWEENNLIGVKNGTPYCVLDAREFGFSDNAIFFPDREGGFIVEDWGKKGTTTFWHLEKSNNGTLLKSNKTVMTIAGLGISAEIRELIYGFNNSSKDYFIEIEDYEEQKDQENDARNSLYVDLIEGNKVDGILLFKMPKEKCIQNGMLADLNQYFEQSGAVSKDSFVDSVMNGMEADDGKIYSVYTGFQLGGQFCRSDFEIENLSDYCTPNSERLLYADGDPVRMLSNMLRYSKSRYIDTKNTEVHLDDEFKKELMLMKMQAESSLIGDEDYAELLIRDGRADVLMEKIEFPYAYFFYEFLFQSRIHTIGNQNRAVIIPNLTEMGICADSANKEGMYEFLDYIFSASNYYDNKLGITDFPVLKSALEDRRKEMTMKQAYEDSMGNEVLPHSFDYGVGEISYEFKGVSDEDYMSLQKMIDEAEYIEPMDNRYMDPILDEASGYFAGKIDLEKAVANMENRLKIALNE